MEGAFKLINPVTKKESGRIVLGMGWHNPLSLPSARPNKPTTTALAASRPATAAAPQPPQSPAVQYGAPPPAAGARPASSPPLPQFPPAATRQPEAAVYGLAAETAGVAAAGVAGGVTAPQLPPFPGRSTNGGFGIATESIAHGGADNQTLSGGRFVPPRVPTDRFGMAAQPQQPSAYGYTAVTAGQPQQLQPQQYGLGHEASFAPPQQSGSPQAVLFAHGNTQVRKHTHRHRCTHTHTVTHR